MWCEISFLPNWDRKKMKAKKGEAKHLGYEAGDIQG